MDPTAPPPATPGAAPGAADTDVLIVGAGPTGLMLAAELGRFGVPYRIAERRAGPVTQTRALGVQARSLELLERHGLAGPAVAEGFRAVEGRLVVDGRVRGTVPLGVAGETATAYPFVLMLPQDRTERLLVGAVEAGGGRVGWTTTLAALAPEAGGADVTLDGPAGPERLRVRYVAGCDGARSAVRAAAGVPFEGGTYAPRFVVADVTVRWAFGHRTLVLVLGDRAFAGFFPMPEPDRFRLVTLVPDALADADEDALTFDDVRPAVEAAVGVPVSFGEVAAFSVYRVHHRYAARFRAGACFLVGDAAHVHSPVGAQGMNTGLQDAANLAWKLAFVAKGWAAPALLDTYDAERRPFARSLVRTTDRAFSLIVSPHPLARAFRRQVFPRLAPRLLRRGAFARFAFRTVAQLRLNYRRGPLAGGGTGLPAGAPRPGDRWPWLPLPDGTTTHALVRAPALHLVLGPDAPAPEGLAGFAAPLHTHRLPDAPGLTVRLGRTAAYVVRPDGYVAYAAGAFDAGAVAAFLRGPMGLVERAGSGG